MILLGIVAYAIFLADFWAISHMSRYPDGKVLSASIPEEVGGEVCILLSQRQQIDPVSLVEMLNDIARKKGVSTVQIALAWLLAQKPFIVPIPGMDKLEYIEDNIKSVDLSLTSEDLRDIEARLKTIAIQGDRLSKTEWRANSILFRQGQHQDRKPRIPFRSFLQA